jgi:HEPN domain-containing protein
VREMSNRWRDWYEQGLRDLEKAKIDLEYKFYEWACFTSQQSAEKVLKALALKLGFNIWGHSLIEILKIINERLEIPEEIKNSARTLDIYYIPARYPNGFSALKPADYFDKSKAEEAIDEANNIIRFCERYLFR